MSVQSAEKSGRVGKQVLWIGTLSTAGLMSQLPSGNFNLYCILVDKDRGWSATGSSNNEWGFRPMNSTKQKMQRPLGRQKWEGWTDTLSIALNLKLRPRYKKRRWPTYPVMTTYCQISREFAGFMKVANCDRLSTYTRCQLQGLYSTIDYAPTASFLRPSIPLLFNL
jgi:hypothetical protein